MGHAGAQVADAHGVAVGTVNLAFFGAEVGVQTVGHLLGDLKGLLIAGHLMVGDGGLDVVTHHIHLVALLNQAEARAVGPYAGLDLIRSVQVAVRLLSAGDEIDRAIAQRLEFGIRMVGQRISGFLKPLVDVGILEHHAVGIRRPIRRRQPSDWRPRGFCCQPAGCQPGRQALWCRFRRSSLTTGRG